jgi:PAS domain S-box-containing protein
MFGVSGGGMQVQGDDIYMVTCDLEYRVTTFNLAAERIFGIACDEAVGRPMPEIICAKEFSSACYAIFLEVRNRSLAWEGEMTARRGNGNLFQTQVRISPIEDGTGKMVGLVAMGQGSEEQIQSDLRTRHAEWLVQEKGRTPSTAWTYEQNLRRLERFLARSAEDINRAGDTDAVRRFLRESDYHPSTKNGVLVGMKSFHKFGALEGEWELNGIMALEAPNVDDRRDRPVAFGVRSGVPRVPALALGLGSVARVSHRTTSDHRSRDRHVPAPCRRARRSPLRPCARGDRGRGCRVRSP